METLYVNVVMLCLLRRERTERRKAMETRVAE